MRKHLLIVSIVIFVAGFALSTVIDGKYLVSLAKGTLSNPVVPEVTPQNTQKLNLPQYWEYRAVGTRTRTGSLSIDKELGALGGQGFEVFSVTHNRQNMGGGFCLAILLRRPK